MFNSLSLLVIMTIKHTIKQQINQALEELYNIEKATFNVDYPPNDNMGDYSCNIAMVLAKRLKKSPLDIGQELSQALNRLSAKSAKRLFEKIEVVKPGFINFHLSPEFLSTQLEIILSEGENFGRGTEGKGENIVLDYSAPNIAKKMHVGHLRSTVIGAAIYNIYNFLGYNVVRDNHLGDWGTQFGKMIYMYKQRYGEEIKQDISVNEMEKIYLEFHRLAKENPELENEARAELKKLQNKDEFNYKLWRLFYDTSIKEFQRVYNILGVDFDLWNGESVYNDDLPGIVEEALARKIAVKSKGAIIINLEKYNLPPLMIQKSDGAFLYGTTDLATIKYRWKNYQPVKNLYVVANQQALHFEQLFKASELLGYTQTMDMQHIKFGLILGKGGKKMSTREGDVADLIDLINNGLTKAREKVLEKNKNLADEELRETAHKLAVGAIKYNDLSQNRLTDIVFDWDKMLSFESGSSPYLQYTYVRIKSIFNKAKTIDDQVDLNLLKEKAELKLIKDMLKFPEMIRAAAGEYKPNLLANYLEDLAHNFHSFYEQVPVIQAEEKVRRARLKLLQAVGQVMKSGLGLLGIECPEKM